MYYKHTHHAYYAKFHGKTVRLGTTEEAAKAEYARLTGGVLQTAAQVVQQFLARPMKPGTLAFYAGPLTEFSASYGQLRVAVLKPYHVSGCRGTMRAIKTAFLWAEKQGYIDKSPFHHVQLPPATSRDGYLSPEQMDKFLRRVPADVMDFVVALRDTGCRPQEARTIEARHMQGMMWVIPASEAKGGRTRVVHLSNEVYEICRRLALTHPEGPLLRNGQGKPWSSAALDGRFARISKRLGFKVVPYSLRHTFATNAIIRGVDLVTLATLMGHSDTKMLAKVYQHVHACGEHMQEGLRKAIA